MDNFIHSDGCIGFPVFSIFIFLQIELRLCCGGCYYKQSYDEYPNVCISTGDGIAESKGIHFQKLIDTNNILGVSPHPYPESLDIINIFKFEDKNDIGYFHCISLIASEAKHIIKCLLDVYSIFSKNFLFMSFARFSICFHFLLNWWEYLYIMGIIPSILVDITCLSILCHITLFMFLQKFCVLMSNQFYQSF